MSPPGFTILTFYISHSCTCCPLVNKNAWKCKSSHQKRYIIVEWDSVLFFTFEFICSKEGSEAVLKGHHGPPKPSGDAWDYEPVQRRNTKRRKHYDHIQPRGLFSPYPHSDHTDKNDLHEGQQLVINDPKRSAALSDMSSWSLMAVSLKGSFRPKYSWYMHLTTQLASL